MIQTLDDFNPKILIQKTLDSHKFVTENSKDISIKLLSYAKKHLHRPKAIYELAKILQSISIADSVEKGIFEYSLLHITLKNSEDNEVVAIYNDKLNDILLNLDDTSYLNNKTLKPSVLSGEIKPELVAFLSAQQLHPMAWADILNKRRFREEKENNMAFTDLYKCRKCGKNKCKITELQIRSADEGTNKFITCLVCFSTFIK